MTRAFRKAKLCVANAVMLRYFDPEKNITIECDASGSGISRVCFKMGSQFCSSLRP